MKGVLVGLLLAVAALGAAATAGAASAPTPAVGVPDAGGARAL
jgi:hypothetical protein